MVIRQGQTYAISIGVPDGVRRVTVTIRNGGRITDRSDVRIIDGRAVLRLDQDDTMAMSTGLAEFQAKALLEDGSVQVSEIASTVVLEGISRERM